VSVALQAELHVQMGQSLQLVHGRPKTSPARFDDEVPEIKAHCAEEIRARIKFGRGESRSIPPVRGTGAFASAKDVDQDVGDYAGSRLNQ